LGNYTGIKRRRWISLNQCSRWSLKLSKVRFYFFCFSPLPVHFVKRCN
jgi:hypothetical protein